MIGLIRLVLRPVERISGRVAAMCWLIVLTFAWLHQHRRRARAWKTLRRNHG